MHAQSWAPASVPRRHRDFEMPLGPVEETPERRRREVTEDGAWPARLDCGQEAALERRIGVPDRVDAAVERVEPTISHANCHRIAGQPALAELVQR